MVSEGLTKGRRNNAAFKKRISPEIKIIFEVHAHAARKNARLPRQNEPVGLGTGGVTVSLEIFRMNRKIYRYIYGYNIKYYDFPIPGKGTENKIA
jgi:hypothetical protein